MTIVAGKKGKSLSEGDEAKKKDPIKEDTDGEFKDDKKDDSDDEGDEDMDKAFVSAFRQYMKKMMARASSFSEGDGEVEPTEPEHSTAPVEPAGAKAAEATPHHLKEQASYEGRIAALEAKLRSQEKEKDRISLVDKAIASLKEEGWEVDPKSEMTMRRLADKSTAPKETLQIFCDSFKQVAPKDPIKFSEFLSRPESGDAEPSDPPEVLKFAQKSRSKSRGRSTSP